MKTQYTLVISMYIDGDEPAAMDHASKIGETLLVYGADSYQLLSINNDLLLIQVIDAPILPLEKNEISIKNGMINGFSIGFLMITLMLTINRIITKIYKKTN